jgi:hypothetical protein
MREKYGIEENWQDLLKACPLIMARLITGLSLDHGKTYYRPVP